MTTYNLTTGQDIITGDANTDNTFVSTLSPSFINGTGPTLNSNDILTGGTNSYNVLEITDDYGAGADILPAGVQLTNIQEIDLLTAGNAGGSLLGGGSTFNTTGVSGDVLDLIVSSGNGNDNVTAAATTTIEVGHSGTGSGEVITNGGLDIGIVTSGAGGVYVNQPSGNVVVQDNGGGEDDVNGGQNVTVYATVPHGTVYIGTHGLAAPTGSIGVSAAAGDHVDIGGGTSVGVAAQGATINIGIHGALPTGDIVVDDFAAAPETGKDVDINGGVNVTVETNSGAVTVENAQGNVGIADASLDPSVTVGTGINVAVTSFGGTVVVGADSSGTVVAPTGVVTVNDVAPVAYDQIVNTSNQSVSVIGGSSVGVATNAGSVTVGSQSGDAGANTTGDVGIIDVATGLAVDAFTGGADAVDVYGGANVVVTALGGNIQIGGGTAAAGGAAATDATGTVSVFNGAVETGGSYDNHVVVYGGDGVSVGISGGDVIVGEDGAAASGAVNIVDVFTGPNTDSFTVVGGSTVFVDTTATESAINIGNIAPLVTAAGNALSNAADYATGDVTVVNGEGVGSAVYLGDGATTISTYGSTSVSVTGGDGATITDVATTQGTGFYAGSAIGPSTLDSVTLNGVEGTVKITSDALTSLSVSNTGGVDNFYDMAGTGDTDVRDATTIKITETPAHTLALGLSNDVGLKVTDATATAVAITTTGADPMVEGTTVTNDLKLAASNATSLSFAGSGDVTLDGTSGLTSLATITASGSGAVNLGDFHGSTTLTSITAATASGPVSVEILPGQTSFVGGSGNDVVTIDSDNFLNSSLSFNTVNGGGGSNTLVVNYAGHGSPVALAAYAQNFQTLELGANAQSTTSAKYYDATGFSSIVDATPNNAVVDNANPNGTLEFVNQITNPSVLSYNLAAAAVPTTLGAGSNTLTIIDAANNSGSPVLDISGASSNVANAVANGNGITSLVIDQQANDFDGTNGLFIQDLTPGAEVSSITVEGPANLTLSQLAETTPSVTTIDASGSTGSVDVSALAAEGTLSHSGVTITGGSGLLTADGVSDASGSMSSAADVLTTGSGGGDLTLGFGGEWAHTPGFLSVTGAYGGGSETVNLSASTAVVDTINITPSYNGVISAFNGTTGGVTGFQVTSSNTTSDRLNYSTAQQNVIKNVGTATSVTSLSTYAAANLVITGGLSALNGLTYTASNGVITFSSTAGGNVDANYSQAALVFAAEIIVDSSLSGGADHIAAFNYNPVGTLGGEFVVSSGDAASITGALGAHGGYHNSNSVVELLGVSGVQGFGSTATGGGAVAGTAAGNTILANVIQVQDAVTGPGAINAIGYSDVLISGPTGTTTITGLGAAGQIDITSALPGPITVTQVGAAGADSLVLNFENASTVSSLTLNSDNTLTISSTPGADVLQSIVDHSGALATIDVTGSGAVTLGAFSTPGLQTIDASANSGDLTVGSSTSYLAVNDLHITGGTGAVDTFFVNGSNLVIDDHSATSTFLSALGNGDSIDAFALTGPTKDAFHTFAAVVSGSNEAITFTNGDLIASGPNDTVSMLGSGFATVGSHATVAVSNVGVDTISVQGDVTGATSSGSFAFTTITPGSASTHAAIDTSDLSIYFNSTTGHEFAAGDTAGGTFTTSLVNVAAATSLGSALDIAAHQALVLDFQGLFAPAGGGGTALNGAGVLVEAAHTGLVDWFQYGGNTFVVEAVNNGASAAAHAGLGVNDVVVELTGLVDLSNNTFSSHTLVHA